MDNLQKIIEDFVDYLMPELTPYEASLYVFLFRNSHMIGEKIVRIGQRTIAQKYGQGPKKAVPSRQHVLRQIKMLEEKGCIAVGDTNREGTLYTVFSPKEIPSVREKLAIKTVVEEEDYYNDSHKRKEIYERDKWVCAYCGEKVSEKNATLDHYIPQSNKGTHKKENLKTCCLQCNSIKSGKTYEEAIPYLLKSIQERKARLNR